MSIDILNVIFIYYKLVFIFQWLLQDVYSCVTTTTTITADHFQNPKRFVSDHLQTTLLPSLNPGKSCFLSVRDLPFYKFHVNGSIKHTVFFVYFISLFVDTFESDPCHKMFLQSSPYQYWIVFPCINMKNVFNHSTRWWIFGLLAVVFFSPTLNHKYLWTFLLDTGFCWFSPFH